MPKNSSMHRATVATVNWYSADLITALFENVEKTAEEIDFSYLVCDNTNGDDKELYDRSHGKYEIIPLQPELPEVWRAKARSGSYAHGQALNLLFSRIETEIAIFVDPDCRLLMHGWDRICSRALHTAIAVGAPYHSRKLTKYQHFPSPIFIAFQTEAMRRLGADWTPYLLPLHVETQDQIRRLLSLIGSRIGEMLIGPQFYGTHIARIMRRFFQNSSKDTGWRVAQNVLANGYKGQLFTPALEARQVAEPFRSNKTVLSLMEQYELFLWEGVPILSHFYGNAHRGRSNADLSLTRWQNLVEGAMLSPD